MRLELSPGFMVLSSLLWLLDGEGVLSALLPGVLLHEGGHALALHCCGARVRALRFEICGLRMDYEGLLLEREELLCALAGPAAGLLYALVASLAGRLLDREYLLCSGGLSLLLSLFNLLPAPMLDGGRALSALGLRRGTLPGLAVGLGLMLLGLHSPGAALGPTGILAGFWVTIGTCQQAFRSIE